MRSYQELARPRYYRDSAHDFLIVVGVWREDGRVVRYNGAASVIVGQSTAVIGWEFDVDYLRQRCRRVDTSAIPSNWRQALDRYIDEEVACVG